jgi:hypothetical protein
MPSKINRFAANSTWIEAIASDAGEVYIGPDEPTDPSVELWYDTDEPDVPVVIPPWNPVVYQNGWRDFGSGWQGASYRKIGDIVYLRGLAAAGTAPGIIFTLPVGCRPVRPHLFACDMANSAHARVDVYDNGTVLHQMSANGYVSLSNIIFSVSA